MYLIHSLQVHLSLLSPANHLLHLLESLGNIAGIIPSDHFDKMKKSVRLLVHILLKG